MTAPRRWIVAMAAAALLTAGCSSSPDVAAPPAPGSSSSSTAQPSPTETSDFCLNLTTFQVGVIAFRADVGVAIEGEPLDFEELRRKADYIAYTAKPMKTSAPPDIAEDFRAVLKGIDTSASHLKEGAKVSDVVDPLYGDDVNPAFEAVNTYECEGASDG